MKKTLLVIIITFAINLTHASISDVFTIDESNITTQMEDLNTLEKFVISNPDLTLSDLQSNHPSLASNILKQEESPYSQLSLLKSNLYSSNSEGCMWILACTCCLSSTVSLVYYYIEIMASAM